MRSEVLNETGMRCISDNNCHNGKQHAHDKATLNSADTLLRKDLIQGHTIN